MSVARARARARWLAVLERAGTRAFPIGEYVGQESFVTAREALALARAAGARPGASVLDLCCGAGGLDLLVAVRTGCQTTGVDLDTDALRIARAGATRSGLQDQTRYVRADAARLPFARAFDAVLLYETLLAFPDPRPLLSEVARVVRPGGRLALTLEAGDPLTPEERALLPNGGTAHLLPEAAFRRALAACGFRVLSLADHTAGHAGIAARLADAFALDRAAITAAVGERAYDDAVTSHRRWAAWLDSGRVRKLAIVAAR